MFILLFLLNLVFLFNFYKIYYFHLNCNNYENFLNNLKTNNIISNSFFFNFFILTKNEFFNSIKDFFLFKKNIPLNYCYDIYKNNEYMKNYILYNYDFNFLDYSYLLNDSYESDDEFEAYSFIFPNNYFKNTKNDIINLNFTKSFKSFKTFKNLKYLNIFMSNECLNLNSVLKNFLNLNSNLGNFNQYVSIYINNKIYNINIKNIALNIGDIIKISFNSIYLDCLYQKFFTDFQTFLVNLTLNYQKH